MPHLIVGMIEPDVLIGHILAELIIKAGYQLGFHEKAGGPSLRLIGAARVNVVLISSELSDVDANTIAARWQSGQTGARIALMGACPTPRSIIQAHRLGLHGYLDRAHNGVGEFISDLHLLCRGGVAYSPNFVQRRDAMLRDNRSYHRLLTDSEERILDLICQGLDDREIADATNLRSSTVQSRRRDIMRKLDINCTPKLMRRGLELGFGRVSMASSPPGQTRPHPCMLECKPEPVAH